MLTRDEFLAILIMYVLPNILVAAYLPNLRWTFWITSTFIIAVALLARIVKWK